MSETEAPNEGGGSSGRALEGPLQDQDVNDPSGDQGVTTVAENPKSSSMNAPAEQPAAVKGKKSDETVENLVALFRDFLEAAPGPATSNSTHTHWQRNTAGQKRKNFGLNKGLSHKNGSNGLYDYEQKYPRERFGEEAADNARVWLTYLDEAEPFDRERVDGWKEITDVLLVFAGLFSVVITIFVSQTSKSLQQDNTQVSASLLFEITQLLRAQSSGTPLNNIPSSTLTPTSSFTPSTNVFLVNGLWFASLAITLSTALFAVLAKQWLYYYMTSIPGTANEKVRVRQLRFNGFELWKVGAIIDLLPVLLHLAIGIFLTGIIILLFPLDIRVAWTIVIITGITYFLYFISVILPVWYPGCPYTTSLTNYVGVLVFSLRTILRWISRTSAKGFRTVWRRINSQVRQTIQRLLQHTYSIFQHAFFSIFKSVGVMCRGFGTLRVTPIARGFPKLTKWREEHIKKAVENAASLDFEALDWLYATSPNKSVHRIIARCVAVHPIISQQFESKNLYYLGQALEISETNVMDLRYGLCLDLLTYPRRHWLCCIPDIEESQLGEVEHRSYSRISENAFSNNYARVMKDTINNDFELPLTMWCIFFKVSQDTAVAAHILTHGHGLIEWKSVPTRGSIRNAGVVSLNSEELGWWKFEYLFRHFFPGTEPDYSLNKTFEIRYLLLITIYRNLTSDQPLIADKKQRQESLSSLFYSFGDWLRSKPDVSPEQFLTLFIDVCCVDAFWSESMTDDGREAAIWCLDKISRSMGSYFASRFPFTECDDLSPIYQWCSRDLDSDLSLYTSPMFALLLVPRNRTRLCTLLSRDPDAVSHLTNCFLNLGNCRSFHLERKYMYPNLMDLLKSVNPKKPLFTVLYNSSVLVQLWKFLVLQKWDAKKFLLVVKSKLDQEKLDELYAAMSEQAQSDKVTDSSRTWKLGYSKDTDILDALEASAREFGQITGVSHPRLEFTNTEDFAPKRASPDGDHNTEERAQVPGVNERGGFHSIADWTKKAFESVCPKTSVE